MVISEIVKFRLPVHLSCMIWYGCTTGRVGDKASEMIYTHQNLYALSTVRTRRSLSESRLTRHVTDCTR
jgi:hypothetical protein